MTSTSRDSPSDTMVYADVTVELLVSMWLLVFAATVLLSLIPGTADLAHRRGRRPARLKR